MTHLDAPVKPATSSHVPYEDQYLGQREIARARACKRSAALKAAKRHQEVAEEMADAQQLLYKMTIQTLIGPARANIELLIEGVTAAAKANLIRQL